MTRRLDVLYVVGTGVWSASMAAGLIAGPPALWASTSYAAIRQWPGLTAWGVPYLLVALLAALALLAHWRGWAPAARLYWAMASLATGLAAAFVVIFLVAWWGGTLVGLTGVINGALLAYLHYAFAVSGGRHEQPGGRRAAVELDRLPGADRPGGGHRRGGAEGVVGYPPPFRPAGHRARGERGPLAPAG